MAMVDLAQNGAEKPIALAEIAQRQNISLNYLEQLFTRLRHANLVESTRGTQGGYLLARSSSQIRIGEIVSAADDSLKVTRCSFEDTRCMSGKKCTTHDLWYALEQHIHFFLNTISLRDVLDNKYGCINRS